MPAPGPLRRESAPADLHVSRAPAAAQGAHASHGPVAWYAEGVSDPLGDRLQLFDTQGPALELLRFRPRFGDVDAFESALRATVAQLDTFRHPAFARVRRVTVLDDPRPQLALVSDHIAGERLSVVLRTARIAGLRAHADAVIRMLRQLVPALVDLHEHTDGIGHGALTPDRIVVSKAGDLVIIEPGVGAALDALRLGRLALWNEVGVARPADVARLVDPRCDIYQVAVVAVTLLLGRAMRGGEYPDGLPHLLDQVHRVLPGGARDPLASWLARALQIEAPGFRTALDAASALDEIMPGDVDGWTSYFLPETTEAPATAHALVKAHRPGTVLFADPTQTDNDAPEPAMRRSRNRWRIVAAVLACATVAEGLWLIRRAEQSATSRHAAVAAVGSAATPARVPAVVPTATTGRGEPEGVADPSVASPASARPPRRETPAVQGPTIGWVRVDAPVAVDVFANGRLIGTAAHARFRVSPGTHRITLVNDARGFRSTQTLRIAAGETVRLTPAVVPER